MNRTNDHDERIAKLTFAFVYPYLLAKVEKKGRTKEELHQVVNWLTGFNEKTRHKQIKDLVTLSQLNFRVVDEVMSPICAVLSRDS